MRHINLWCTGKDSLNCVQTIKVINLEVKQYLVYLKLRESIDEWCLHITMLLPVLGVALPKGYIDQNLKLKSDAYCIMCDICLHGKKMFIEGRGVFTKLRWVFMLESCLIPCILGRGQFLPSWLGPLSIEITFSFLQWGVRIVCLYVFADSHVKATSERGMMV